MSSITQYISKQFRKPSGFGGILSTFFMNWLNGKLYIAVKNIVQNNANEKVLDIGFGNGVLIKKLASKTNNTFYGVEISEDMLKAAQKRNKYLINSGKVNLQYGNVASLPFEDDFFDKIYTINTIYFWEDINECLQEVNRVLKPNGVFINVIYTKQWLDKLKYTNYGFVKFEVSDLKNIILSNGFRLLEIREIEPNVSYCMLMQK